MQDTGFVKSDEAVASIEEGLTAAGQSHFESGQVDYFAFDEEYRVLLPDGISWLVCKALNEGDRMKYQKSVNRDVRLQKATGDAIMRMTPGEEKRALLEASIKDWNLLRKGQPVSFNTGNLNDFLNKADPRLVDKIEKEVRKHNSWLLAEATVEDIDAQIKELQELRETRLKEEEGKGS